MATESFFFRYILPVALYNSLPGIEIFTSNRDFHNLLIYPHQPEILTTNVMR